MFSNNLKLIFYREKIWKSLEKQTQQYVLLQNEENIRGMDPKELQQLINEKKETEKVAEKIKLIENASQGSEREKLLLEEQKKLKESYDSQIQLLHQTFYEEKKSLLEKHKQEKEELIAKHSLEISQLNGKITKLLTNPPPIIQNMPISTNPTNNNKLEDYQSPPPPLIIPNTTVSSSEGGGVLKIPTQVDSTEVETGSSPSISGSENSLPSTPILEPEASLPPAPPPPPGLEGEDNLIPPPPPGLASEFGGPPPPPPLPGMSMDTLSSGNEPKYKPHSKMKQLFWTKLQSKQLKGTIWDKIDSEKVDLDTKEIENLFCFEKKGEEDIKGGKKDDFVCIVDPAHARNFGIFLTYTKLNETELIEALFQMNENVLNLERIKELQKMIPSLDEVSLHYNFLILIF